MNALDRRQYDGPNKWAPTYPRHLYFPLDDFCRRTSQVDVILYVKNDEIELPLVKRLQLALTFL